MPHWTSPSRANTIVLLLLVWTRLGGAQDPPRYLQPDLFTYDELQILSGAEELDARLQAKLDQLLTTPFVSNEAHYRGAQAHRPQLPGLGPSLRIVAWNIERGFHLDSIISAFNTPEAFATQAAALDPNLDRPRLEEELEILRTADVIVLNEADWGLKRSDYRSVPRELAEALDMNWTFGVEFVEVDPITLGTEQFEEVEDAQVRQGLDDATAVDPYRVQALHGTAVLSRYPILEARLTPFALQPYNWFDSEKRRLSPVEAGKRRAAEVVIATTISREVRRGGRMHLAVDLAVPDLQEGVMTVVATHLEIRAKPKRRREQLEEILEAVQPLRHPVVIAGDMNTSGGNSEPTSLKRELFRRLGSKTYWTHTGIKYATGFGLLYDLARGGLNFFKNNLDPTAKHVPLLAPNPEKQFFRALKGFRSEDGTAFDFRGVAERTVAGYGGTLGASNERDKKGFRVTFEVQRTFGLLGKAKLDWIFVKPYIEEPDQEGGPYAFAPHFGRTLVEVNEALERYLSDHRPISVDLPFTEVDAAALSALPRRFQHGRKPPKTVGEGAGTVARTADGGLAKAGSAGKGVFTGGNDEDQRTAAEALPAADFNGTQRDPAAGVAR